MEKRTVILRNGNLRNVEYTYLPIGERETVTYEGEPVEGAFSYNIQGDKITLTEIVTRPKVGLSALNTMYSKFEYIAKEHGCKTLEAFPTERLATYLKRKGWREDRENDFPELFNPEFYIKQLK